MRDVRSAEWIYYLGVVSRLCGFWLLVGFVDYLWNDITVY